MYDITEKSVFNVQADVLVNAVNTVGVMGAGIALEFKLRYPEMYKDYYTRCINNKVQVGKPYLYENILNFPTKEHWKSPSRLEWLDKGLMYFSNSYKSMGIKSIAFPKLGCGRGGLDWEEVQKMMIYYFEPLKDIEITICLDTKHPEGIESSMIEYACAKNPEWNRIRRFSDLNYILRDKTAYEELFREAYRACHLNQM